jgi:hypothetical protein
MSQKNLDISNTIAAHDQILHFPKGGQASLAANEWLIWSGGERAKKVLVKHWASAARTASTEAIIQAEYAALQSLVEKWDLTPRRVVITH